MLGWVCVNFHETLKPPEQVSEPWAVFKVLSVFLDRAWWRFALMWVGSH